MSLPIITTQSLNKNWPFSKQLRDPHSTCCLLWFDEVNLQYFARENFSVPAYLCLWLPESWRVVSGVWCPPHAHGRRTATVWVQVAPQTPEGRSVCTEPAGSTLRTSHCCHQKTTSVSEEQRWGRTRLKPTRSPGELQHTVCPCVCPCVLLSVSVWVCVSVCGADGWRYERRRYESKPDHTFNLTHIYIYRYIFIDI